MVSRGISRLSICLGSLLTLTPIFSATAAGDYVGPVVTSVTLSPTSVDVSDGPALVTVIVKATDPSGLKKEDTQLVLGETRTLLKVIDSSATEATFQAKVVIRKRARPGVVDLGPCTVADSFGNTTDCFIPNDPPAKLNIINTVGNPDPNEIPTLPDGVSVTDFLTAAWLLHFPDIQNQVSVAGKNLVDLQKSVPKGITIPGLNDLKPPPLNWYGDSILDVQTLTNYEMAASQFVAKTRSFANQLKRMLAQSKKGSTITCKRGKALKKITAINPICPTGYKKV